MNWNNTELVHCVQLYNKCTILQAVAVSFTVKTLVEIIHQPVEIIHQNRWIIGALYKPPVLVSITKGVVDIFHHVWWYIATKCGGTVCQ